MSLTNIFRIVRDTMRRRPLLYSSVVYGSFCTSAEFIRQSYVGMSKPVESIADEPADTTVTRGPVLIRIQKFCEMLGLVDVDDDLAQLTAYNRPQLKRYAIYGCFLAGPILHGWYKWLDAFYRGTSVRIVLTKLLMDQFLLTPPLLVVFFTSMSLMEAKSDILRECRIKFVHTFQTSCGYWLPVQLVNFMLIPPSLRVTYVSIAAFCWVNIMCYLKSIPTVENASEK